MEKRKYLHAFVAVCRNCQGAGIKVTYDMADTLKQRPGVRKACPVCEGSGMVKISGVQVLTIVPARPLTLELKDEIAGQARNDGTEVRNISIVSSLADQSRKEWEGVRNDALVGLDLSRPHLYDRNIGDRDLQLRHHTDMSSLIDQVAAQTKEWVKKRQ